MTLTLLTLRFSQVHISYKVVNDVTLVTKAVQLHTMYSTGLKRSRSRKFAIWMSRCTVQLRGKLTLASDSLASATAYTRECERCHSRTSVECSRVLHPSLACYSRVLDPSLACLILASARSRVLLATARPLARVCYLRLLDRSLACYLRVLEA